MQILTYLKSDACLWLMGCGSAYGYASQIQYVAYSHSNVVEVTRSFSHPLVYFYSILYTKVGMNLYLIFCLDYLIKVKE